MISGINLTIASALLAASISYGIAAKIHYTRGHEDAAKKSKVVILSLKSEISTSKDEFNQCTLANLQYQAAVQQQREEIEKKLNKILENDLKAEGKNKASDQRLISAARQSALAAEETRKAISDAIDQCINDHVPSNYVGMLNNIIDTANGIKSDGDTLPPQ